MCAKIMSRLLAPRNGNEKGLLLNAAEWKYGRVCQSVFVKYAFRQHGGGARVHSSISASHADCTNVYSSTYVGMHEVCTHVCIYIYIGIYRYKYLCAYAHTHTHVCKQLTAHPSDVAA